MLGAKLAARINVINKFLISVSSDVRQSKRFDCGATLSSVLPDSNRVNLPVASTVVFCTIVPNEVKDDKEKNKAQGVEADQSGDDGR
jgi:hypothetical protein